MHRGGLGRFLLVFLTTCILSFSGNACTPKEKPLLYFRDLVPPVGAGPVTIISDVSQNLEKGGEITVIAVVDPNIDRDELDFLMQSFYRQTKERQGFMQGDFANKIELRFYATADDAKQVNSSWLARVYRSDRAQKPEYSNLQKLPLLKMAQKTLGKQPEFTGALKPVLTADAANMAMTAIVPIVAHDGTGAYIHELTFLRVVTDFISYARTFFDSIGELKKVTFIGRHDDKDVATIWLTREQYKALDLRQVEESLGAYQGQFIELIIARRITEKAVAMKVEQQRRKIYREALAKLPKEQVIMDTHLR